MRKVLIFFLFCTLIFVIYELDQLTSKGDVTTEPLKVEFTVESKFKEPKSDQCNIHNCLFPGFGERNARVLFVNSEDISSINKTACINLTIKPREYYINGKRCEYCGKVKLYAYLGSKLDACLSDHWSFLSSKLGQRVGESDWVDLNSTVNVTACVKGPMGDYYLYLVVSSQQGWKSWNCVTVRIVKTTLKVIYITEGVAGKRP